MEDIGGCLALNDIVFYINNPYAGKTTHQTAQGQCAIRSFLRQGNESCYNRAPLLLCDTGIEFNNLKVPILLD